MNKETFNFQRNTKTLAYVIKNDTFNIRHNTCSSVVLENTNGKSKYQCLVCDLDIGQEDIYKGDRHTDSELNKLLILARDLLLLDNKVFN